MTKKIEINFFGENKKQKINSDSSRVRVRIIKAPLVDTAELRSIIYARAKAIIL